MAQELKLPELGENIDAVEITAVLVSAGDAIKRDQPVIEVETEKASLEVPSEHDGTVSEVLVSAGDKVQVGQTLLRVEAGDGSEAKAGSDPDSKRSKSKSETKAKAKPDREKPETKAESKSDREPERETKKEPGSEPETEPKRAAPQEREQEPAAGRSVIDFPRATPSGEEPRIGATVPASPSTRRLARELGVDLFQVHGSGPGGRIRREDVKAHAKAIVTGAAAPGVGPGAIPAPRLPDFSKWGEVETEPLSNVRRATAKAMASAWSTVPHVTQFDHADITQLESMRKRFNRRPEAQDRKLTMTAIVIKMVASGLKQFPKFNASLDLANDRVVYKKYVHIGVAVDTDRGLLVPVLRDVDRKGLVQVAEELNDLAQRARDKKIGLDEMQGAGFTVSNLGGLGTTYFSPIVNWPEVAILGVGRAEQRAAFEDGGFVPRLTLPLSLSYDHRLVDGADCARFLRWLAEALEQPLLLLLDD